MRLSTRTLAVAATIALLSATGVGVAQAAPAGHKGQSVSRHGGHDHGQGGHNGQGSGRSGKHEGHGHGGKGHGGNGYGWGREDRGSKIGNLAVCAVGLKTDPASPAKDALKVALQTERSTFRTDVKAARTAYQAAVAGPKATLMTALAAATTPQDKINAFLAFDSATASAQTDLANAVEAATVKAATAADAAYATYYGANGASTTEQANRQACRTSVIGAAATLRSTLAGLKATEHTARIANLTTLAAALTAATTDADRAAAMTAFETAEHAARTAFRTGAQAAEATYQAAVASAASTLAATL